MKDLLTIINKDITSDMSVLEVLVTSIETETAGLRNRFDKFKGVPVNITSVSGSLSRLKADIREMETRVARVEILAKLKDNIEKLHAS